MPTRTRHIREFVETLFGPIVFIVYLGLAYFLTSAGCMLAADPTPVLDVSTTGIGMALAAITVLALGLIALVGFAGARGIRRSGSDKEDRFLAYITFMLSILSGVAVLWVVAALVSFPLCT